MTDVSRETPVLDRVTAVYRGSDSMATCGLYAELELVTNGMVAVNLLRICKKSSRAKTYRGRSKGSAYSGKDWALGQLVDLLPASGLAWGWGEDLSLKYDGDPHHHILYVELPSGQVSFHMAWRHPTPYHDRGWDGVRHMAAERICAWAATLLGEAMSILPPSNEDAKSDKPGSGLVVSDSAPGLDLVGGPSGETPGPSSLAVGRTTRVAKGVEARQMDLFS